MAFSIGHAQAQDQAPIHRTTVVVVDEIPAIAPITVYSTQHITIWGCPDWETNCPVRNGRTQAVITATVGATTTICPLTYSQARLSSFNIDQPNTGGALSTTTTTWPTAYSLPTSFPALSSYPNIDWSSIFPSGAPAFSKGAVTGSFAPGEYTPLPPDYSPSLSPEQASILGLPARGNASMITASDARPTETVSITTGTFAAIMPSNVTAYITTLNAYTETTNLSSSSPPETRNGSYLAYPALSTASNTGRIASPIEQQTVNVSPVVPVNLFGLLVAITAIAFAI
ncbi:uncharacterized protein PV09_07656 [Verruconis gallopava]|uniref:Uncharacterized protein n=1 Tax=Verruconis gallopava TaxID=253628 RepID=A0A0D1XFC2_9PEZI|nr:uncharacterized protein PV09_07656 [Verruconis gallopava]KIW00911.1 hypothetical protein PV09_07656 [Verruconis gallopava]